MKATTGQQQRQLCTQTNTTETTIWRPKIDLFSGNYKQWNILVCMRARTHTRDQRFGKAEYNYHLCYSMRVESAWSQDRNFWKQNA